MRHPSLFLKHNYKHINNAAYYLTTLTSLPHTRLYLNAAIWPLYLYYTRADWHWFQLYSWSLGHFTILHKHSLIHKPYVIYFNSFISFSFYFVLISTLLQLLPLVIYGFTDSVIKSKILFHCYETILFGLPLYTLPWQIFLNTVIIELLHNTNLTWYIFNINR